jgi:malonate-semialdehyde dehydrogenase (acetylating)/methylmalonate-semialdehyde dehydrogenase
MPTETNVVIPEQKSEFADMSSTKSKARILANYIGGRWVPAQATGLLDVTNPSNGEVLARVPLSGVSEIEAAVSAASAALPDWRARSVGERTDFIYALREKFRQRTDELAESVTREGGKVISDARAEINRAIEVLEVACSAPMMMQGRVLEGVSRGINTETIRQPVGVCAAITPFNFRAWCRCGSCLSPSFTGTHLF